MWRTVAYLTLILGLLAVASPYPGVTAALDATTALTTAQVASAPEAMADGIPASAVAADAIGEARQAAADTAPAFSGDLAHQHVEALAVDVGSRPAGSEAQTRAQQYLLDHFRRLGYQADLQPFPIRFYHDRGSRLTLAGAPDTTIDARTLTYSAAGTVDAPLMFVGLGRPEDLAGRDLTDRIALVQRGEIRFSDKVDAAAQAGAQAVVIFNNQPGNFSGSLVFPSTIPVVGISQADGDTVLQTLQAGAVTAHLSVDASTDSATAANVVATRGDGSRTIVIGGHFDSVSAGPGANDNGSGTAVLLELARVLAVRGSPFTIQIVAFDAEEIGLRGSAHMVAHLSDDERRAIRAMINLDMVGVGDSARAGGSDELVAAAMDVGTALGERVRPLGGEGTGSSDHASFQAAGIPALFIYRSSDPNYHSANDRAEYVDPAHLKFAGDLALGVIERLEQGE
ncbi:MAG: M20/M25/M40 family metallo-hydrolase [Chloroflexi bacterium]|nr:M20/M25/M40 family metallo-hydrolase [Chloroflexota bacterium]